MSSWASAIALAILSLEMWLYPGRRVVLAGRVVTDGAGFWTLWRASMVMASLKLGTDELIEWRMMPGMLLLNSIFWTAQ